MRWVQWANDEFTGEPPSPRSGHSAVMMGGGRLLIFGGLMDKTFLGDLVVLDTGNNLWFRPECTGSSNEDGGVGPGPRAFHASAALDCHLFIFGGRSGKKRLGDFWMLDTDTWSWVELSAYGEQPPARDFGTAVGVGSDRLALFGGWDGSKWLSDVYLLDTMSLEWHQLPVPSPPPARCGHTALMVERRMLILGGRGGGGAIMGDLWALKGMFQDEKEAGWTHLRLPGNAPAARCGHSCTPFGTQVVVFGGHGTGGWITRYDVYYNDAVVLDRVQWRKLTPLGEPPAPRAYHSLTRVGKRLFLFGGFDGKTTFGDFWWLLPPDDPLAQRAAEVEDRAKEAAAAATSPASVVPLPDVTHSQSSPGQEQDSEEELMAALRAKLGLPPETNDFVPPVGKSPHGLDDPELIHFGLRIIASRREGSEGQPTPSAANAVEAARTYLKEADSSALLLKDLKVLLTDYRRLISGLHPASSVGDEVSSIPLFRFHHLKNVNEIRLGDVAVIQSEYHQLLGNLAAARPPAGRAS